MKFACRLVNIFFLSSLFIFSVGGLILCLNNSVAQAAPIANSVAKSTSVKSVSSNLVPDCSNASQSKLDNYPKNSEGYIKIGTTQEWLNATGCYDLLDRYSSQHRQLLIDTNKIHFLPLDYSGQTVSLQVDSVSTTAGKADCGVFKFGIVGETLKYPLEIDKDMRHVCFADFNSTSSDLFYDGNVVDNEVESYGSGNIISPSRWNTVILYDVIVDNVTATCQVGFGFDVIQTPGSNNTVYFHYEYSHPATETVMNSCGVLGTYSNAHYNDVILKNTNLKVSLNFPEDYDAEGLSPHVSRNNNLIWDLEYRQIGLQTYFAGLLSGSLYGGTVVNSYADHNSKISFIGSDKNQSENSDYSQWYVGGLVGASTDYYINSGSFGAADIECVYNNISYAKINIDSSAKYNGADSFSYVFDSVSPFVEDDYYNNYSANFSSKIVKGKHSDETGTDQIVYPHQLTHAAQAYYQLVNLCQPTEKIDSNICFEYNLKQLPDTYTDNEDSAPFENHPLSFYYQDYAVSFGFSLFKSYDEFIFNNIGHAPTTDLIPEDFTKLPTDDLYTYNKNAIKTVNTYDANYLGNSNEALPTGQYNSFNSAKERSSQAYLSLANDNQTSYQDIAKQLNYFIPTIMKYNLATSGHSKPVSDGGTQTLDMTDGGYPLTFVATSDPDEPIQFGEVGFKVTLQSETDVKVNPNQTGEVNIPVTITPENLDSWPTNDFYQDMNAEITNTNCTGLDTDAELHGCAYNDWWNGVGVTYKRGKMNQNILPFYVQDSFSVNPNQLQYQIMSFEDVLPELTQYILDDDESEIIDTATIDNSILSSDNFIKQLFSSNQAQVGNVFAKTNPKSKIGTYYASYLEAPNLNSNIASRTSKIKLIVKQPDSGKNPSDSENTDTGNHQKAKPIIHPAQKAKAITPDSSVALTGVDLVNVFLMLLIISVFAYFIKIEYNKR
ncbi:MAG: hypothetical protein LBM13_02910 [Candidatus Ancillula sp.]|jgi:hypothetical protein|nr:hypothetical protein [Candidatus Ancillula sp.]